MKNSNCVFPTKINTLKTQAKHVYICRDTTGRDRYNVNYHHGNKLYNYLDSEVGWLSPLCTLGRDRGYRGRRRERAVKRREREVARKEEGGETEATGEGGER